MMSDAVELTAALIRCPSVTPEEGGALQLLSDLLGAGGFECRRVDRNGTPNLFASWGSAGAGPVLGFNGHTDVVPPGDPERWTHSPFSAHLADGVLWGRGAVDMKSGVAAFVTAAIEFVSLTPPQGALALLITGDEEGKASDGTVAILDWMEARGLHMDACLVGEPTSPSRLGEMIKIGRRGSLSAKITATGRQGHSAYPQKARNPLPVLVSYLDDLTKSSLDEGTSHFEPSTLALTSIDTGNSAGNVIPGQASARLNIRFNDTHGSEALKAWLLGRAAEISAGSEVTLALSFSVAGEAFLTQPGPLTDIIATAVEAQTGIRPELSTSGGTSDARFIRRHCPAAEFGLVGSTMHQIDERVEIAQIQALKDIYLQILRDYFASDSSPSQRKTSSIC